MHQFINLSGPLSPRISISIVAVKHRTKDELNLINEAVKKAIIEHGLGGVL